VRGSLETIDLLGREAVADPYATFGRLREQDPVHWSASHRSWVITRYDDVAAAFVDARLSSDRVRAIYDSKLSDAERTARAPTFEVLSDWMVFKDPPDHTRLRNLVKRAFTPRAIQALEPRIAGVVEYVLDTAPRGELDVVRHVAYPIPAMVIADMLGVPAEDRDLFRAWSDDITTLVFEGARTDADRLRAQHGLTALSEYLGELVRRNRAEPGENLISALVRAREDDDTLTEHEIVNTCTLLLFGGHETTTNLLANGFLALVRNPGEAELLRADPSLARSAVEELNRYDGPAKMVVRRAGEAFELRGRRIDAGSRVLLVQCAANRDPRRFEDPDRLDLRRAENRQLGFGYGIHYCLGAPLARLEAQLALPRMLERLRDPELLVDEPEYQPVLLTRALTRLPIRHGG
jgi:cytochrome P450